MTTATNLLDEPEIESLASTLHAMAHPLRYKILCLLAQGEMRMQDLVNAINTSHSNAYQHLTLLRAQGLIRMRKVASRVYFRLRDQRTLQLMVASRHILSVSAA